MRTSITKRCASETGSARSLWLACLASLVLISAITGLELRTTVPDWLLPARHLTVGVLHWVKANFSTAALSAAAAVVGVLVPFLIRWLDRRPVRHADQERRTQQRTIMLQRVHFKWITGVLEPSLAKAARLVLGLEPRSDLLDLGTRSVSRVGRPPEPLPEGAPISDVFDRVGGGLLIVGSPGAGKTTVLLQLCAELLDRAQDDLSQPIPVVFNLASWAHERPTLSAWLIDELSRGYQVPHRIASSWVEQDELILLLDGLDEVSRVHRAACADAINSWRQEHGLVRLIVCSRTQELEELSTKLRLEGAVELQPPTAAQVDRYLSYLESTGTQLADVRAALLIDSQLRELLHSPLLLHVVALAYHGRPALALFSSGTLTQRQALLWEAYLQRMFEQRPLPPNCRYTRERAIDWLTWLARTLHDRNQTEFHLDRLAPEWFPTRVEQRRVHFIIACMGGLIGGLVGGVTFALLKRTLDMDLTTISGLVAGLVTGLAAGLLGGLVIGLAGGLTIRLESAERINWSWSKLRVGSILNARNRRSAGHERSTEPAPNAPYAIVFGVTSAIIAGVAGGRIEGRILGLFATLASGLGCGLSWGLIALMAGGLLINIEPVEQLRWSWSKLRTGLLPAATGGLIGGLIFGTVAAVAGGRPAANVAVPGSGLTVALIGGLISGLSAGLRPERAVPNEGIRRSAQYCAIVGSFVGLSAGLIFGAFAALFFGSRAGVVAGLSWGLAWGAAAGLMFGGAACLQHYVIRLWLVRKGVACWHYGPFLEAMTERLLMRRSGSAFLFTHRLLRDYLAELGRVDNGAPRTIELPRSGKKG
jgi:hypothetical protein